MRKSTATLAVLLVALAVALTYTLTKGERDDFAGPLNILPREAGARAETTNVTIVDGQQVIEVLAKQSYSPRLTLAKAGVPSVLRLRTSDTLDCTLSVTIPSLRYRKVLPSTGVTEVALAAQAAGSTLQGVCSMGMYGFTVRFV